jgi:hypothetical protein
MPVANTSAYAAKITAEKRCIVLSPGLLVRCHDIQNDDIQLYDTQHSERNCDTRDNIFTVILSAIMLSVILLFVIMLIVILLRVIVLKLFCKCHYTELY